eukprot:COSAG01_NODE_1746_length_9334_cov_42.941419_4_plen_442_part_00
MSTASAAPADGTGATVPPRTVGPVAPGLSLQLMPSPPPVDGGTAVAQETTFLSDHLRLPIAKLPNDEGGGRTVLLGNWPKHLCTAAIAVPRIRALLEPLGRVYATTLRSNRETGELWVYATFEAAQSVTRAMSTTIEVSKAVPGGIKAAIDEARRDLEKLTVPQLQREALAGGVDSQRLEDALEEHDPQERKAEVLELVLAQRRRALQDWSESGGGTGGAVNLAISCAEVDFSVSGVCSLQLRRELVEEVACMVRVSNVPTERSPRTGEALPLETNRKLAEIICDMLIGDEESHPEEGGMDRAEGAVSRVTLQIGGGPALVGPGAQLASRSCVALVTLISVTAPPPPSPLPPCPRPIMSKVRSGLTPGVVGVATWRGARQAAAASRVLRAAATRTPTYWDAASSQEVILDMRPATSVEELAPVVLFKGYEIQGTVRGDGMV